MMPTALENRAEWPEIVKHRNDFTLNELALKYSASKSTIKAALDRNNIKRTPMPSGGTRRLVRPDKRAQTVSARRSKVDAYAGLIGTMSDKRVADHAGVTPAAVRNYRIMRGIPSWAETVKKQTAKPVEKAPPAPSVQPANNTAPTPVPVPEQQAAPPAPRVEIAEMPAVTVAQAPELALAFMLEYKISDGDVQKGVVVAKSFADAAVVATKFVDSLDAAQVVSMAYAAVGIC